MTSLVIGTVADIGHYQPAGPYSWRDRETWILDLDPRTTTVDGRPWWFADRPQVQTTVDPECLVGDRVEMLCPVMGSVLQPEHVGRVS